MDKYHIYEEIGSGQHSQVYKGREKKTIEYVAIKRVDKAQMDKVVTEVQILHRLSSPLILKFHDWYETRNNLWLILEYCTGSDLSTVVKQDKGMPESSVRRFGLDLLASLSYLHGNSILHCDLKPSNVLIDEHGILKVKGFGNARKIPKIQDVKAKEKLRCSISHVGNVTYMAPELFVDGGVHSFASDFWSLGCIIFELFSGLPAFASKNLELLINQVLSEDPPELSVEGGLGGTYELEDLLLGLMAKESFDRLIWPELVHHEFWGDMKVTEPSPLPAQPLYEKVMAEWMKTEEIHHNGEEQPEDSKTFGASLRASVNVSSIVEANHRPTTAEATYQNGHRRTPPPEDTFSANTMEETGGRELNDLQDHKNGNHTTNHDNQAVRNKGQTVSDLGHSLNKLAVEDSLHQHSHELHGTPQKQRSSEERVGSIMEQVYRSPSLEQLINHPDDLKVKPIVGNVTIRPLPEPTYEPAVLPFDDIPPEQVPQQSEAELEEFLTLIYRSLNFGGAADPEGNKVHVLGYLQKVSTNPGVAYILINSPLFLSLLLKMVLYAESQKVRADVANLLGLFVRYTKYIAPAEENAEEGGLLTVLFRLAYAEHTEIRRNSLAALGELLYYISTQDPSEEEEQDGFVWSIPRQVDEVLIHSLNDSDTIIQHYACKALENIYAQGTEQYANVFVAGNLGCALGWVSVGVAMASSPAAAPDLQATARSSLAHLLYRLKILLSNTSADATAGGADLNPVSWEDLDSHLAPLLPSQLVDVLTEGNTQVQMSFLNLLNNILNIGHTIFPKTCEAIPQKEDILLVLLKIAGHGGTASVRAKGLVGLGLVLWLRPVWVGLACDNRLLQCCTRPVEKVEGGDPYLVAAAGALLMHLAQAGMAAIGSLDTALNLVLQGQSFDVLTGPMARCSAILHLLSSPILRCEIVHADMLQHLSSCLVTAARIEAHHDQSEVWATSEDVTNVLLSIVECLSHHTKQLLPYASVVFNQMLPALCQLFNIQRTDKRTLVVALLRVLIPSFLIFAVKDQDILNECISFLTRIFLPQLPVLMNDKTLITNITLRVLLETLEVWDGFSNLLAEAHIMPLLIQQLGAPKEEDSSTSGILTALLTVLLETEGASKIEIIQLGVVSSTLSNFRHAVEMDHVQMMSWYLEVLLAALQFTVDLIDSSNTGREHPMESSHIVEEKIETLLNEVPLICLAMHKGCRQSDDSACQQVIESSSKCLSLLYQIFGDTFLHILFLDCSDAQRPEGSTPRECFSQVLVDSCRDKKSKLRILHLLWMASNTDESYKRLLHEEPLWSSLQICSHIQDQKFGDSKQCADTESVTSLAVDICRFVESKNIH